MSDSMPGTPGPAAQSPFRPREERDGRGEQQDDACARGAEAVEDGAVEPEGPAPIGVPKAPTGDPLIDALMERLADADHLPADGHLEVYEDVHRGLRDALTALDARPGPAPGAPSPSPSHI